MRDKKKGVLVQKVFVPVNTTSFAFVSCRRCVSHATSYRAERWFGFSFVTFVIVGNGGRRCGSTTGIDGARSLSVSVRGVSCPKSGSFCGVQLRECIALVPTQATCRTPTVGRARGVKTRASKVCRRGRSRCEDAGEQDVQTRTIKV